MSVSGKPPPPFWSSCSGGPNRSRWRCDRGGTQEGAQPHVPRVANPLIPAQGAPVDLVALCGLRRWLRLGRSSLARSLIVTGDRAPRTHPSPASKRDRNYRPSPPPAERGLATLTPRRRWRQLNCGTPSANEVQFDGRTKVGARERPTDEGDNAAGKGFLATAVMSREGDERDRP